MGKIKRFWDIFIGQQPHPVLYFAGDDLDEREMVHPLEFPAAIVYSDGQVQVVGRPGDYPSMASITVGAQTYCVRQLDRHLVYRSLYHPPARDALFLPNTSLSEFAEALSRRKPGRCIMHRPRCIGEVYTRYEDFIDDRVGEQCFYLCFDVNGAGFALHPTRFRKRPSPLPGFDFERVDFRWDAGALLAYPDVLTAPVEQLRELCDTLFETQINPKLRNPYLNKLEPVLLSWRAGSEAELRTLARAICITEPGMFDVQEPATVVYRATTPQKRGGFLRVERGYPGEGEYYLSPRLMMLNDLAFRCNPFMGMEWLDRSGEYRYVQKSALHVQVIVEPPTAHEKAEAFSTLLDWLDEKLYDPNKRARFGLPPRIVPE